MENEEFWLDIITRNSVYGKFAKTTPPPEYFVISGLPLTEQEQKERKSVAIFLVPMNSSEKKMTEYQTPKQMLELWADQTGLGAETKVLHEIGYYVLFFASPLNGKPWNMQVKIPFVVARTWNDFHKAGFVDAIRKQWFEMRAKDSLK